MKRLVILSLVLLFFASESMEAQTRKEEKAARKAAQEQQVCDLVDSGSFAISFDRANPTRGMSRTLSPDYEMKFENNRVTTYLPYFGTAHTAPMDPTKLAIELTDQEIDVKTEKDPKKGYSVTFSAKTQTNENITFYLKITYSGMATLSINSSTREPISYLGNLKM
ncbi:MAG: DUF4251 domain-containing protein [Bacteroidales bacterium]|jgi:hypothetical protein